MTEPEQTDHRAEAEKWLAKTEPPSQAKALLKPTGLRCQWTDDPLGQLQQCQRPAGHDGDHDYGNAAVRR